jgi:hypothetical protein
MKSLPIHVHPKAGPINRRIERSLNRVVRGYDGVMAKLGLGGRKAQYDDAHYEFMGGAQDGLRSKHYDKSLRLLWKAERELPWTTFRDCTREERALFEMAEQSMSVEERKAHAQITSQQFRDLLDREYTHEQKEAIVTVLSAIGHGEAYAWLVSAEVLGDVQSTGAKAALTMQVIEEAKHFVVLRELMLAFQVEIPRQSVWEYLLLEQVYKAKGLEKLFGMNVLVEGIALSLFGMLAHLPGLEVLRLFHLDESRHTALPVNYFAEFPMSRWERSNPLRRWNRLRLVLPSLPLVFYLEEPLARLGIDAFAFGGSVIRKVAILADRAGFMLPVSGDELGEGINGLFNAYAGATRRDHQFQQYHLADTTRGAAVEAVEAEIFAAA